MSKISTSKKIIILVAVIAVVFVLILVKALGGDQTAPDPGASSAGVTESESSGFVMEDSATVDVDIKDDGAAADENATTGAATE
ncbi:MAG: hypothetical protein LBG82_09210 [Clostridiales Family XIII bacterium]|nr:hypothetical protein [Clostridiales Family XIII bacterium]